MSDINLSHLETALYLMMAIVIATPALLLGAAGALYARFANQGLGRDRWRRSAAVGAGAGIVFGLALVGIFWLSILL
jgi:hypothetical protein